MAKKNLTIRDVAELAGVSVSTVSRIISGTESLIPISEETRKKVFKAANELSYRPHPGARALRGKSTNMLGVIVREVNDPFFSQLIHSISVAAQQRGYEIVLGTANADPDIALKLSETMLNMRYCDGLLLLGDLMETPADRTYLVKMGWNLPLVLVCRGTKQLVGDNISIGTDNQAGTRMALEYLAGLGHQKIAFISGGRLGDLNERQETYEKFINERFGQVVKEYLMVTENSLEGGYQAANKILALPEPPTAILASDDTMAMGVLKAAADLSVRVPQDLSVIGFDDIQMASFTIPALTTVHQPIDQIGEQVVEMLINLLKSDNCIGPQQHVNIQPELIIRKSCCPPKS
jgi:DNA-binding LacI/PurR family transcriptional regulator